MRSLVFLLAGCGLFVAECATTRYWVGGDGNWSDTVHWKGGIKPADGEAVQFSNNIGPITVNMDEDSAALAYYTLENQTEGGLPNAVTLVGSGRFGQTLNYTSNNAIGNGRMLIVDGPRVEASNNIYVGTNAVLELRSGELITRKSSGSNGLCLRQGATVLVSGGRMSISAIVNDSAADEGAFDSVFRISGGTVEIFSSDAFGSHFHPEWTEIRFDGGEVIANKRLAYVNRYLLPPKGSSFVSSCEGDCEGECKDVQDGVYEIGGSVALTNREAAYFNVGVNGSALAGGGSLAVPILTFGVYQGTASLDLSVLNLGTSLNSSSYSGEIAINDGLTLGCWNDICVGGNKGSDFNVFGPLKVDTLDCFDRVTPHAVQLQQWFDFSGMTDFEATGGGTVMIASKVASKYLHDFTVGAGTTLDISSNAADKVVADRLVLGANSVLKAGANKVSAAISQTVDPTAVVRYAFPVETFEVGGRYLLWEGPYGTVPPVSSFRFDPALPEGWFVTNFNNVAWISDGTVVPYSIDHDATHKAHWTGEGETALWSDTANWYEGTRPSGVSHYAYFTGDRRLCSSNDTSFSEFRNVVFLQSAGPYVLSGNYLPSNYGGPSGYSVASYSPFPQRVEAQIGTNRSNRAVKGIGLYSQGGSYLETVGGGLGGDLPLWFRGDVRLGGVWEAGTLVPQNADAASRKTRLSVLPDGELRVQNQHWTGADSYVNSNQVNACGYVVHAGARMTVDGEVWRWTTNPNTHIVDGVLQVACPMQTTVRQTFRGAGEISLACARADASAASEFKFADAVTVRPASWQTVREGADNPLRMVVRDNVTIGANGDWTYGPAAGFASASEATNRALTVEGGAKSAVTFDSEGHAITLADPLVVSKFSRVVKRGAGSLALASDENVFDRTEFSVEGGDLVLAKPQRFGKISFADGTRLVLDGDLAAAADEGGWVTLFAAESVEGDIPLENGWRVSVAPGAHGVGVTVMTKVRKGSVMIIR